MTTPEPSKTRSPAREMFIELLVPLGTFALFLAGLAATALFSYFAVAPTDGAALDAVFLKAVAVTTLVAISGAALYRFGRGIRRRSKPQQEIRRFAGNLIFAIGAAWIALSGACTLFLWSLSPSTGDWIMLVPTAIGVLLCGTGWAMRQAAVES